MLDRLAWRPHGLYLNLGKLGDEIPHGFRMLYSVEGRRKGGARTISLSWKSRGKDSLLVSVRFKRAGGGLLRVTKIEANLAKLIYGHNGRLIKTEEEFLLALTRVVHIVMQLVGADNWSRILPGTGRGNLGFWSYLELPIHVSDDGRLIAAASGLRRSKARLQLGIWADETVSYDGTVSGFILYDKGKERRSTSISIPGVRCMRIEAKLKECGRVATAFGVTQPDEGPIHVLSTFSFADAIDAFKREMEPILSQVTLPPVTGGKDKIANFIHAVAVSQGVPVPELLGLYVQQGLGAAKTLGRLKKKLRDLAAQPFQSLGFMDDLPGQLLNGPEVIAQATEEEFQEVVRAWNWPTTPSDPVREAYTRTTILISKPSEDELETRPKTGLRFLNQPPVSGAS